MLDTPDVTTETKASVTTTSGFSLNSQEGQQWQYLVLMLLGAAMIGFIPALVEQGKWLFTAGGAALFAKSRQS